MPHDPVRFAIYFVPRPGCRLAEFGETIFTRGRLPMVLAGFDAPAWNEAPQRYGFHATLKAPFSLRGGCTQSDLAIAATAVASAMRRFKVARLAITRLDGFIALTPVAVTVELDRLAGACVRGFDHLRAPLTADDRERRLAAALSAREIEYLDRWGYPYIFDSFKFHMTLTGSLVPERLEPLQRAIAAHYAAFDGPVEIDAITLCRQPSRDANFEVWQRFEFQS